MSERGSVVSTVNPLIVEIGRLNGENARLRAALTDLAEHGTRHDLNPTHLAGDEAFWHRYIQRMDTHVRTFAALAIEEQS